MKSIALLAAIALLALTVGGCGSDSSSSSNDRTTQEQNASAAKEPEGSSAPSEEFRGAGNAVATVGREGTPEELEDVSAVVEASLRARAARDWVGQCATLAASTKTRLEAQLESQTLAGEKRTGCPSLLAAEAKGVPAKFLRDNMADGVGALRIEGNKGFALYHGDDGSDWVLEMTKEADGWKVNNLAASEIAR